MIAISEEEFGRLREDGIKTYLSVGNTPQPLKPMTMIAMGYFDHQDTEFAWECDLFANGVYHVAIAQKADHLESKDFIHFDEGNLDGRLADKVQQEINKFRSDRNV